MAKIIRYNLLKIKRNTIKKKKVLIKLEYNHQNLLRRNKTNKIMIQIIQLFYVIEKFRVKVWMLKNKLIKKIQNGFNHHNLIPA